MSAETSPRPFLKWAGGKRQLLPQLRRYYPREIRGYHEPFLGSGAVFFDLWNLGRLRGVPVRLTDGNSDLVGCYLRLVDATDAVIATLGDLAAGHQRDATAHYYAVRDEQFNPARAAWRAGGGAAAAYTPVLAAMLIYLNRTGYNGLFRQNAGGGFNVPAGRYDRPRILDEPRLRAVARVLADPRITLAEAPFEQVRATARRGHFVYFDPPYAPLSSTSRFRAYTARGFEDDDQRRLQAVAVGLAGRGVHVLLSHSTAPIVSALFERDHAARAAGLVAHRIKARRGINSRADARGAIDELLVSTGGPHPDVAAPAPGLAPADIP